MDWLTNQNNQMTINIVQQGVSLFVGLLIFIKQYDFQAMFASVRKRREEARRQKELKRLEKFKRLLEMTKNGISIDIEKVNLSSDHDEPKGRISSEEEEEKIERVMRTTRKKQLKRENGIV
jgi:hypothetical protein